MLPSQVTLSDKRRRTFGLPKRLVAIMAKPLNTQSAGVHSEARQSPGHSDNDKIAQATIEEARMVLPGIQALFGFQLVAAFNQRFADLSVPHQYLHYVALILTAASAALVMTPAAYHRIAEPYTNSDRFVVLASRLVAGAMIPLMLAIAGDVYLLGVMITGSVALSFAVGLALLALLTSLWFVFPFAAAAARGGNPNEGDP
jgi:hypothetical protein